MSNKSDNKRDRHVGKWAWSSTWYVHFSDFHVRNLRQHLSHASIQNLAWPCFNTKPTTTTTKNNKSRNRRWSIKIKTSSQLYEKANFCYLYRVSGKILLVNVYDYWYFCWKFSVLLLVKFMCAFCKSVKVLVKQYEVLMSQGRNLWHVNTLYKHQSTLKEVFS